MSGFKPKFKKVRGVTVYDDSYVYPGPPNPKNVFTLEGNRQLEFPKHWQLRLFKWLWRQARQT